MTAKSLTFKEVNRILTEGTAEEVAQLQAQIAQIETAIQQRTKTLLAQKQRLSTMLAQKQRALGAEQKQQAQQTQQNQQNQQNQQPQVQ